MASLQSKFAEITNKVKDIAARCQKESAERRRLTYWVIRQSDDRMVRANETIDRTRDLLKIAGKPHETSNGESKLDPDQAWGELLLHGSKNPKRRADD